MILIFEGCDRVGKTTFINEWFGKRDPESRPEIIHCTGPPAGLTPFEAYAHQRQYNTDMVNYMIDNPDKSFVFDRFMYGELVWGKMFRGYDAPYVWELERKLKKYRPDSMLVMMTATIATIKSRHDGNGVDIARINEAQAAYYDVYQRAKMPKMLLWTDELSSEHMADMIHAAMPGSIE